jgi:hypothetical protein
MGSPSTTPIFGAAAEGVAQVGAAVTQARAIRAKGDFDEKSILMAKSVEELRARDIRKRGRQLEQRHLQNVRKLIGAQKVSLAAQGVVVGVGSGRDIQLETHEIGAVDALMIRTNAEREALGVEFGIEGLGMQAKLADIAAETEFASTLLTGGLQAARAFYRGTFDWYKLNPPRLTPERTFSGGLAPGGAQSLFAFP